MEDRKLKEIEYYNREAREALVSRKEAGGSLELDIFSLASYQFLTNFVKSNFKGGSILDYGCGTGVHLSWLSQVFNHIEAIDLSEKSIEQAKRRVIAPGGDKISLSVQDCEHTNFPDNSFDVVFDGGTFSSLDFQSALREINRLLKPGGYLVGIETLGHNFLANFKRSMNVARGTRTKWAADHIFKMEDLTFAKEYFEVEQVKFFHIISWMFLPLVKFPGGKYILRILEATDWTIITVLPFLKKYSFKVVFVLKRK